ncbi:MAG: phage baseplate assembly protein V, partial [Flavobacteriaceae bacterium]|nr:phage baseplate assembly protein V [Flavobacteriaceae bacterium]
MKDYNSNEDSSQEDKKGNQKVYYRSDFGVSFTPFAYVTVNGEEIAQKYAVDVKIEQALCEHTVFELLIPSEAFEDRGTYPARHSKELLGAGVTIELKQFGETAFSCTGEVVRIGFQVKNKYPYVKLTGKSPTWKMDSGKQCRSFENQTLEQIVTTVTEPYTLNGLPIIIAPRTKESFEYIVMSNESVFEFLRRLAIRFGEYFFWNGITLVFGRTGMNEVKLQEGRDFHEYNLSMQAKPQHFIYKAYDYKEVETHEIDSRSTSDGKPFNPVNPFQRRTVSDSENLFSEAPVSYTPSLLGEGKSALTNAVLRQKELRRNTAYLTAKTDNPGLRLGSVANVEAWVRDYLSFKNEHVAIEEYLVTQITHSYNSQGYYNTFTAVPLEQEIAPNMDESFFPRCTQQNAVVTDNNDPEEMSRIRVRFPWQKPEEQTPWLRIVTPYAGEGKGMHVIPEIEEEVMVIFEGGNAEKPLVLGALFNGKGKSGYGGEGNYKKAFQTKNTLRLVDDEEGSIMGKDKDGSFWKLEGDGTLRLKAKQITIDTEEDIYFNAGRNMVLNVSDRLSVLASHLKQKVSEAMKMFSGEALISSKKKINLQTKSLSVAGTKKAFIHSDKETILNSKGTSYVKGQKYELGNKADSYQKEKEEEEEKKDKEKEKKIEEKKEKVKAAIEEKKDAFESITEKAKSMIDQEDSMVDVVDVFFGKKVENGDRVDFEKINDVNLGEEVYVVALCSGQTGKLKIKLKEELSADPKVMDDPVKFLVEGEERTEIEFSIGQLIYTYYQKIKIRPKEENSFEKIGKKLKDRKDKKVTIYLRARVTDTENEIKWGYRSSKFDAVEGSYVTDYLVEDGEKFEVKKRENWHDPV